MCVANSFAAIFKRAIEKFINTIATPLSSSKKTMHRLVLLRAELLSSEYLAVLATRAENLSIKLTLITTCLPIGKRLTVGLHCIFKDSMLTTGCTIQVIFDV